MCSHVGVTTSQEEKNAYTKSDAVLRIATYLENPLLPMAGAIGPLFPRFIRDTVYDTVADNRQGGTVYVSYCSFTRHAATRV